MKNQFAVIITLLFLNFAFGQNGENNNGLYVINMLGAKVYEKPTFDSKTLTELPIGKNLIVEKSIETKEQFRIGENFSLPGKWIKPNGINGFVFSSDLTDKKAKVSKNEYGQINLNLKGKLNSEKKEEKLIKTENGEFPKFVEYRYYENGTYTYTSWDGCFDHVTEYKNLTLSEVYHQMVSDYYGLMGDSETWIPIFQGKEGNIIKFEGEGATNDLQIEINADGIIKVSSYDCT
jgi:hypothetical protein